MSLWNRALNALGIASGIEQRSFENPEIPISASIEDWNSFFGLLERNNALPLVGVEAALGVPTVLCIVAFLSRTMAALPCHTFEAGENGARVDDDVAQLLSFAPNDGQTSFDWRRYHWQQVFTVGRGLSLIERRGDRPVAIVQIDATKATVFRREGRRFYRVDGKDYPEGDVIDTPFMLKNDGLGSYSPIGKCNKAISLAIAMGDFAGSFFASGGVPPLVLSGPLPSGPEAFKRAQADIRRSIDLAKRGQDAFFGIPAGHDLKPIGFEPSKGQMVEARLFQIQEMARVWQMPPVFVGDLSKGTFSNTEQQDLQLVKHLVMQWACQFENELTLKLYGWRRPPRRVKHNLDGLQRGAFKDRTEALARAILTGQLTPDEARALENRPPMEGGDRLYVQQATVPLVMAGNTVGQDPGIGGNGGPPLDDNQQEDGADDDA